MVRAKWRRFARGCLASGLGSAPLLALLLGACSNRDARSEEPPIITHPRTAEASQGRWSACIHEPSPLPDDIQRAIDELPSLADCPRTEPLPCGACDDEGFLCTAAVTRGCCDRPYVKDGTMSPFDAWVCRCEGGAYNCWPQFVAAAACPECGPPPAGVCSENTGECPEGCFDVEAALFDPERGCVARTFESIGCSSIEETTSDLGCVRRVSDGAIYVSGSYTRHLQSDAWQPCSPDEIASTQVVCE